MQVSNRRAEIQIQAKQAGVEADGSMSRQTERKAGRKRKEAEQAGGSRLADKQAQA